MRRSYQFITFEKDGDVFCARLKQPRIEDNQMEDLGAELAHLIEEEHARKIVLCLGPEEPECLISVFLAKLISLQRRLDVMKGAFVLAQVSEHTRGIFRAAGIEKFFHFYPDSQAAIQALHASA